MVTVEGGEGEGRGGNAHICRSTSRHLTMRSPRQLLTLTPALRLTESGQLWKGGGGGKEGRGIPLSVTLEVNPSP